MADEKKPEPKNEAPKKDTFEEVVIFIFGVMIVLYLVNSIFTFIFSNPLIRHFREGDFSKAALVRSGTRPISSLARPIGSAVLVVKDSLDVYDSPGGRVIFSKSLQSRGTIIGGPAEVGGKRFWLVRFDDGDEGWVEEEGIGYPERGNFLTRVVLFLWPYFVFFKYLIWLVCAALVLFIAYVITRLGNVRENRRKLLYPERPVVAEREVNPKWQRIMDHVESGNENDWRLAVLEADIMLDDLLEKLGLPGESIGDKLKAVEKSDFRTIDNAWEAHKIRNQIAHTGQDFAISSREARRVIELYHSVFEEFEII